MFKPLLLLFLVLSGFATLIGYFFLTEKMTDWEWQIIAGQKQFDQGQSSFENGNEQIEVGRKKLSAAKAEYEQTINNPLLVLADRIFKRGQSFHEAKNLIADGDRQISEGLNKIEIAEKQLMATRLELRRGRSDFKMAHTARQACAFGAALFIFLALVLGLSWRRAYVRSNVQEG